MAGYFKDLLLNLFLIFLPLLFYPYILSTRPVKRAVTFFIFGVALILTMSFPVVIHNSTFDFRAVPLAIGSLYGGAYVSLFLYVIAVVYRFLMGSPNPLEYVFAICPTFLIVLMIVKRFPSFTVVQKVAASMFAYFIIRSFTLFAYSYFTGNLDSLFRNQFAALVYTMIFQCIISGLYAYVLEVLRNNSRLREEIIKSEKIKIVSEIAASVAHEVRNPLTSVRGFIQLMGRDLTAEKRRYYQKVCLEELDRAQQIISDYLTLAKPFPETIEDIDMKEEIDYITNVLVSYANYQNVQIISELADDSLTVTGDRYKFRQALINIGKNGIEAMPSGGILKITARRVNNDVRIAVIDTGVGMTTEQINRLGTPYYSTKDKGTGLGTMVSFKIIHEMHGTIDVKSEPGKGSTFTVTLQLIN